MSLQIIEPSQICKTLDSNYYPACRAQCHCGVQDDSVVFFTIFDPFGPVVPSCESEICLEHARAILDAKRRVSLTFPFSSPKEIYIRRTSGEIEGGFIPTKLHFSITEDQWIVAVVKETTEQSLSRGVYAKDILPLNKELVLILKENRFLERELLADINKSCGGKLFVI